MLLLSSAASQNPDGRDQVLVDPYLAVGEHMHPALGPRSRAPVVRVRQLLGHDDENLSSFAVASAAIVAETIGPGELAGLDGLRDHVVGHVTVEMTVQNLFVTDLAALYVLFKEQSAQVPVLVDLYLVYSDAFEAETAVKELADTIVLLFDEKDVWPHFCAIYLHCIVYFFIICNLTSILIQLKFLIIK